MADRIGGRMERFQPLRFTVTQVGTPPESLTPGMVPGVTDVPGIFSVPGPHRENANLVETGPILRPQGVTRGLGIEPTEEMAFRKFLDGILNSDNEALLRQQLISYCMSHGFDPELRQVLTRRAMSYYKTTGKAQGNAERIRQKARGVTPDEVPMKMDMQKAFVVGGDYLRKGMTPACLEALQGLLARLQAMRECYHVLHWSSSGAASYGDHLLFERIYTTVAGEVDATAEKLLGLSGSMVAAQSMAKRASAAVAGMQVSPLGMLDVEQAFCADDIPECKAIMLREGALSEGLDNFFQGLADAHETHVYLLKQRTGPAVFVLAKADDDEEDKSMNPKDDGAGFVISGDPLMKPGEPVTVRPEIYGIDVDARSTREPRKASRS